MKVLALLATIGAANGHVQVLQSTNSQIVETSWAVRNAGGNGDGRMSTNGPCGGVDGYGVKGTNAVVDGQQVCARFNYNGGHNNNANTIQAAFECEGDGDINAEASFVTAQRLPLKTIAGLTSPVDAAGTGVNYAVRNVDEAAGALPFTDEGIVMCVDLPEENVAQGVEKKCTLSFLDQRDWGGCLDLAVAAKPAQPTPRPSAEPIVPQSFPTQAAGVYTIDSCDTESGGKCCLAGTMTVTANGQISADLSGLTHAASTGVGTETPEEAAFCALYAGKVNALLEWEGDRDATFSSRQSLQAASAEPVGGEVASPQDLKFTARDPLTNGIHIAIMGADLPILSVASASRTGDVPAAPTGPGVGAPAGPGAGPTGPGVADPNAPADLVDGGEGSNLAVPLGAAGAGVAVLAVGAFLYNQRSQASTTPAMGPGSVVAANQQYGAYDQEAARYGGYPQQQQQQQQYGGYR